MEILKLAVFLVAVGVLEAKIIPGQCPTVSTKLDFDATPYLGDWYQQQGNPTWYQPAEVQCVRATYGANDDGSISVHNVDSNPDPDHGWQTGEVCGYATATDVGGVFEVHFPFNPVPGDYEVLETDYESYACVWSCFSDPLGLTHTEIGYILTREQEYNQETVDICLNLYKEQGLDAMLEGFVTFYSGADCSYEVPSPDPSCE